MASKIDSATVNPLLLSHIEFFFGNLAPLHIHDLIDVSSFLDPVPNPSQSDAYLKAWW